MIWHVRRDLNYGYKAAQPTYSQWTHDIRTTLLQRCFTVSTS